MLLHLLIHRDPCFNATEATLYQPHRTSTVLILSSGIAFCGTPVCGRSFCLDTNLLLIFFISITNVRASQHVSHKKRGGGIALTLVHCYCDLSTSASAYLG
jgi:hypothetical protein